ncbi:MAG: hypothetical protein H0X66_21760 [Verrucomicrobia bacterium]|nr:hypothetical protein [Verrucomicrobiota bacterium]
MNLLPHHPMDHEVRNQPPQSALFGAAPASPPATLESEYSALRESYERRVSNLKEKGVGAPRGNVWLSFLGLSLRNMQFVRK